jgi:hypothetical protein
MATNHNKWRGSCFYDAPNGPPTPGSPLPLFPIPYSSVGKVQARPHPSREGRGVGLRSVLRIALIEPTSIMRGEGHPGGVVSCV